MYLYTDIHSYVQITDGFLRMVLNVHGPGGLCIEIDVKISPFHFCQIQVWHPTSCYRVGRYRGVKVENRILYMFTLQKWG